MRSFIMWVVLYSIQIIAVMTLWGITIPQIFEGAPYLDGFGAFGLILLVRFILIDWDEVFEGGLWKRVVDAWEER